MRNDVSRAESGNAIFYVLLAVALLAALAFAVTQSSRSSLETLTEDRISLLATDMLDYADVVKTAVAQLRLRRVPFNAISFAHPDLDAAYGNFGDNPPNEVFNGAGGGILYQAPQQEALAAAGPYVFTAGNEVKNVSTTCAGNACAELMMISPPLARNVCIAINNRLGIANPGGEPPVDTAIETGALFNGVAVYSRTIGDEATSSVLEYESAGCLQEDASGNYYFYQVLLPR